MVLSVGEYDPDEPEGSKRPGTQYISRKDLRWIFVILVVLVIAALPVFKGMRDQRDKSVCASNIKAIYGSMMLYAALNDDRLPPLYDIGDNGAPMMYDGKPLVWASLLAPAMTKRASFLCPSAEEGEAMPALGDDGEKLVDMELTYGMYLSMGSQPHMRLESPTTTALILETSNNGAMGAFNPLPFRDLSGQVVPFDAFMVGFDDSNVEFTEYTRWVTRLALRGAPDGESLKDAKPRHAAGIHVVYVDGHLGKLFGPDADVDNVYPDLGGLWRSR
ncbi:MAG: hypothetical protein IH945_08850 [Armatimonadetes bacterium]|nr:hypothetical protein [Armatimonadota bacterium]